MSAACPPLTQRQMPSQGGRARLCSGPPLRLRGERLGSPPPLARPPPPPSAVILERLRSLSTLDVCGMASAEGGGEDCTARVLMLRRAPPHPSTAICWSCWARGRAARRCGPGCAAAAAGGAAAGTRAARPLPAGRQQQQREHLSPLCISTPRPVSPDPSGRPLVLWGPAGAAHAPAVVLRRAPRPVRRRRGPRRRGLHQLRFLRARKAVADLARELELLREYVVSPLLPLRVRRLLLLHPHSLSLYVCSQALNATAVRKICKKFLKYVRPPPLPLPPPPAPPSPRGASEGGGLGLRRR